MTTDPSERWVEVRRVEWTDATSRTSEDRVAREEPLEIRIGGVPIAVVMRTPGHDLDLVRGFLLTEQIVRSLTEIASVRHCTTVETPEAEDNVVLVAPAAGVELDLAALRRNLFTSSSCGVCGKASIDRVLAVAEPLTSAVRVDPQWLYELPEQLRAEQAVFDQTGGLHAAGLFASGGGPLVVREDVGRHNAVDKSIGAIASAAGVEADVLVVSGRVSFEIVQKALAARVPIIVSVSAPTSMAVQLAERSGLTLASFVRGRRMCVYTSDDRIVAQ